MNAAEVSAGLRRLADPAIAAHSRRFFRTGPGEYGAGDLFLGIRVPELRRRVPAFADMPLPEIRQLLHSSYHEERLFALLLLVRRFERAQTAGQSDEPAAIYSLYLAETAYINNWDLVDTSAPQIVGGWLLERVQERQRLYQLAVSASLWERRIAILATFHFIRAGELDDTLRLAEVLLTDAEDLIHKAVGWMLREAGKRDLTRLRAFLAQNRQQMPRTMLRYAIEKLPEEERRAQLARVA